MSDEFRQGQGLPIFGGQHRRVENWPAGVAPGQALRPLSARAEQANVLVYQSARSEEHTSELQSPCNLVCRLLLEKKKALTTLRYRSPSITRWTSSSPHTRRRSLQVPSTPSLPISSRSPTSSSSAPCAAMCCDHTT